MINLYELMALEKQIDKIAEENSGEIPDELLKQLVEAEMQSLVKIENICKYLKHLELFMEACRTEEKRIAKKRQVAENTIERFKIYMTPYIKEQGKVEAGTFKLSIRKSDKVNLVDGFDNIDYCNVVRTVTPDKNLIKKALKEGKEIPGARLDEFDNLQIK